MEAQGCSVAELSAALDAFATFAVRDSQVLRCSSAALAGHAGLLEGDIEACHVCDLCDSLARLRWAGKEMPLASCPGGPTPTR